MARPTPTTPKEGDPLTAKEIAEKYRVSEGHITALAKKGEIPGFRVGGSWRFDPAEVHQAFCARALTTRQPKSKS